MNGLYVYEAAAGRVRIIDPDSGVLFDTLQLPSGFGMQHQFVVDATGQRIYAGSNASNEWVYVYDAHTGGQLHSWRAPVPEGDLWLNPANGLLYHES